MRKKSGFTLIELMVVMAIIAILATAGITSYGGYIKKARDATRLQDAQALETVAISSFSSMGQSVSPESFISAVNAMNNDVTLKDPLDESGSCLNASGNASQEKCEYTYSQCQNGGYILRFKFESLSNHPLYTQDKLNADSEEGSNSSYDIGNCDSVSGSETAIR